MIPKIIHYCWLSGDPYPELVQKCIDSWSTFLPDYQFMLWDKKRFDIHSVKWVEEAYNCKKYAFAADYIRFYALYNYGGIYLDADVEVLKTFDPLLEGEYFLGRECGGDIEAAVIGVKPQADWVKECLEHYTNRGFVKEDGSYDMAPVPVLVNDIAEKNNLSIHPYQFFSPKNYWTKRIETNTDTYCIHHFDGKWVVNNSKNKVKGVIHKTLFALFGVNGHAKIIRMLRKLK